MTRQIISWADVTQQQLQSVLYLRIKAWELVRKEPLESKTTGTNDWEQNFKQSVAMALFNLR